MKAHAVERFQAFGRIQLTTAPIAYGDDELKTVSFDVFGRTGKETAQPLEM